MVSLNIIQLWIIPLKEEYKPVTDLEKDLAKLMPPHRAKEFLLSRGLIRDVLSKYFAIPALDIPLIAKPGKPPVLKNNLGYISLSHCKDALFLGWSDINLGIDIERKQRNFKPFSIIKKFYFQEEKKELEVINLEELRSKTLKFWVLKEAAIKWQKGSICSDLSKWLISSNFKKAHHIDKNISLNICYLEFESWSLGIAHNKSNVDIRPIIKISSFSY